MLASFRYQCRDKGVGAVVLQDNKVCGGIVEQHRQPGMAENSQGHAEELDRGIRRNVG